MPVSLIIAGASKSGTTALFEILKQSPEFFLPKKKELHYFSYPFLKKTTSGPGDHYVVEEIPTSLENYLSYYSKIKRGQIGVDISPSYLFYPTSAEEIHKTFPQVKIIFILRNPTDKIFSQYIHLLNEGRETLNFEEALRQEVRRKKQGYSDMWLYRESGKYVDNIKHFYNIFGIDNVRVFLHDDLCEAPDTVLENICNFCNINSQPNFNTTLTANRSGKPRSQLISRIIGPNFFTYFLRRILPPSFGLTMRNMIRKLNTGVKPNMTPKTKFALQEFFDDEIQQLEKLLGTSTGWRKIKTLSNNGGK